jgi:hypothetical protein
MICISRGNMWARAPMLRGSSCTHSDLAQVRVARDQLQDLALRERVEQLDARDRQARCPRGRGGRRGRSRSCLCTAPARDLRVVDAGLGEHRLEGVFSARSASVLVACGRRSSDFGVITTAGAAWRSRLAAQQVEVLRRGRRARDADVALGGERAGSAPGAPRSAPGPEPS